MIRKIAFAFTLTVSLPLLGGGAPYLVKDINEHVAPASSWPSRFTTLGSLVFFTTSDSSYGYPGELWRTDGTETGTFRINAGPVHRRVVFNGRLWFLSGGALWSTDGTVAGTQQLALPVSNLEYLMGTSTHLYFTVDGKLWRSNGTAAGTAQASADSFYLGTSDYEPQGWTSVGSRLLFFAYVWNGSQMAQYQIWIADANSVALLPSCCRLLMCRLATPAASSTTLTVAIAPSA